MSLTENMTERVLEKGRNIKSLLPPISARVWNRHLSYSISTTLTLEKLPKRHAQAVDCRNVIVHITQLPCELVYTIERCYKLYIPSKYMYLVIFANTPFSSLTLFFTRTPPTALLRGTRNSRAYWVHQFRLIASTLDFFYSIHTRYRVTLVNVGKTPLAVLLYIAPKPPLFSSPPRHSYCDFHDSESVKSERSSPSFSFTLPP